MALDFFMNAVNNGLNQLPNESFRDRQQAAINAMWDVTTNRYNIKQQVDIGSNEYQDIEVWIGNAMGETTRGMANGDDFKKLIFRDLNQVVKKGLYYQFDDNTWITHFTDKHDSIDVNIGVRRCNNIMRIIDPENGSIFSIPCVVEYDMTAPNVQVTSSILTPNNHAKVMVQGNKDTLRLFKLNTRYIFGGRPFKLLAFQDTLIDKSISNETTLLYLDLFLDELHAKDDIENQLADNGEYNYTIDIDSSNMELVSGTTGVLNASVALNGQEVNREIVWSSSSEGVVTIDNNGQYDVVGSDGDNCEIMVNLKDNPDVSAIIKISIVSAEVLQPKIIVEPFFNKVRQYEKIEFDVQTTYGSKLYFPTQSNVQIEQGAEKYLSVQKDGNKYVVTGKQISVKPVTLTITVQNDVPNFSTTIDFTVNVVSMMG